MTVLFTDHDANNIQFEINYSEIEMKLLFTAKELTTLRNGGSVTSDPSIGNHNTVKIAA